MIYLNSIPAKSAAWLYCTSGAFTSHAQGVFKCTVGKKLSGGVSHQGEALHLECWSPGLQPRIPPWCLPSHGREQGVSPLPGSRRLRAAAGLCVGGGSAAGAQTHVEINWHLRDRELHVTHIKWCSHSRVSWEIHNKSRRILFVFVTTNCRM